MMSPILADKQSLHAMFWKAWSTYWYRKKKFHQRLLEDGKKQQEVCALFFETLNELGLLDKAYPLDKIKRGLKEGV